MYFVFSFPPSLNIIYDIDRIEIERKTRHMSVVCIYTIDKGEKKEIKKGSNPLCKKILGSMVNMIIRECRHSVVAMIIVRLVANIDTLNTGFFSSRLEVFREKLTLFVKVVSSSL